MNHLQRGERKILDELTLPATSERPVRLIVTDMAVIEPTPEGLVLKELAPGVTVDAVVAATEAEFTIDPRVTLMPVGADRP